MNNELPHIERPKANSLWRQRQSKEFDLYKNSSTLSTVPVQFWSTNKSVYSNCNFSIYSQQKCNASCTFCVEELRPASRGCELKDHKKIEENLDHYLYALDQSLNCVSELRPSISITGGEPSKDPNIHKIFSCIGKGRSHKLSMTSNASGLLDIQNNKTVLDAFLEIMPQHLNISLAHYDREENSYLMRYKEGLNNSQLRQVVEKSHNKTVEYDSLVRY